MWKKWKIWDKVYEKSMLRAFARSRAKNRRFVGTEFVKTCDELVSSVSSIGSFVEKKSCSSTEELYPNGKSKKIAKYFTLFFSAAVVSRVS